MPADSTLAKLEAVSFPVVVKDGKYPGKWTDFETFESRKYGPCKTLEAAAKSAGVPWLALYHGLVRYNEGEPVFSFEAKRPIPGFRREVTVYRLFTLKKPAEKYRQAHDPNMAGSSLPPSDDDFLTARELWDALVDENGNKVFKKWDDIKTWCDRWRNRESKLRPGKEIPGENAALRAREEFVTTSTKGRNTPWHHRLGDARAILKGEEDLYPAQRGPDDDEAKRLIKAHVEKVGPIRIDDLRAFCKKHLIGAPRRKRLVKELKMRAHQVGSQRHKFWCLPDQNPPSVLDESPKRRKAFEFLKAQLAQGEKPLEELIKLAKPLGLKRSNLMDAKPHAGVISRLESIKPEGGRQRLHYALWSLLDRPVVGPVVAGNCRVILGKFGEPIMVGGKTKSIGSYSQFSVVQSLVVIWPRALSKDEIERVNSAARRMLRKLSQDPDWKPFIHFPRVKGEGYRIG